MPPEDLAPEDLSSQDPEDLSSEDLAPEDVAPDELAPDQAAQWARRAGLPLEPGRTDLVTATANHIHAVVSTLRELDFGDVPPAFDTPLVPVAPQAPGTPSVPEARHEAL
ncbi:hypothetical protein GPA10_13440 [Streptomyces sp. p1417]|uniref:Uncharacterized protein n=1 Tax=Streptomyces typhae TaxID=2681492 RepID=A0A6L6WUJ8_9ACTN|nr:hypothetical protein [Streptomyces typhae]